MTDYSVPCTSTATLIVAMHVLARDIQSGDGMANAAIKEAGDRLGELQLLLTRCLPLVMAKHHAEHARLGKKTRDMDTLLSDIKKAINE